MGTNNKFLCTIAHLKIIMSLLLFQVVILYIYIYSFIPGIGFDTINTILLLYCILLYFIYAVAGVFLILT